MADDRKTFLLRADPSLWKEIERWASDELRSVNGQIEFILREAVRRRARAGGAAPGAAGAQESGGEPPAGA
ncbi:MAG TPA: hypothetical protein VKG78_12910 [Opitutaceae bacterium]|nr:hypothetical protein [Opitutaceae bacterium]